MSIESYLFRRPTRELLYKSLDASAKRNRAISQNIANVTTDGYKRKEVRFEELNQDALKIKINGETTKDTHLDIGKAAAMSKVVPLVSESNDQTLPGDINNVDIDIEMAKLAENQIQYQYSIKFSGFDKYQSAISGRV